MNGGITPIVSVVIPTYNHAEFLREALQSVCRQSFSKWEAIVVNNYSSDDTIAIVESFDDPRIRLENYRNHGVIASSRNHGIKLAIGIYIAFLDSDDTWHPDKLASCIPYLENGADLIAHGLKVIGEREGTIYCGPKQNATFNALLEKGTCITTSATIVRKNVLVENGSFSENPVFNTSEDYHLWLKLARANIDMVFLNTILGEYRIHSSNLSGSSIKQINSALSVIDEFIPINVDTGLTFRIRARRCKAMPYYGAGRSLYKKGLFSEAWPLFWKSVVYWPFKIKTYIAIGLNCFAWFGIKLQWFRKRLD